MESICEKCMVIQHSHLITLVFQKLLPGHGPLLQVWLSDCISEGQGYPPLEGGLQYLNRS